MLPSDSLSVHLSWILLRCTLVGNKIVDHSDVVGSSPIGAAPTTSSFPTYHLASKDWAKTTARWNKKYLNLEIWCSLYQRFDSSLLGFQILGWYLGSPSLTCSCLICCAQWLVAGRSEYLGCGLEIKIPSSIFSRNVLVTGFLISQPDELDLGLLVSEPWELLFVQLKTNVTFAHGMSHQVRPLRLCQDTGIIYSMIHQMN